MYIVHLKDGRTITEKEMNWKEIQEVSNNFQDITSLQLKRGNNYFTVSVEGKNVKLLQLKRAILDVLTGKNTLTERVVGFIIEDKSTSSSIKKL